MEKVTIVSTIIMDLVLMGGSTCFADDSAFGLSNSDVARISAGNGHTIILSEPRLPLHKWLTA